MTFILLMTLASANLSVSVTVEPSYTVSPDGTTDPNATVTYGDIYTTVNF